MFSFLQDIGNYDQRKLARDTVRGVDISTAWTSDEGFETALLPPGQPVIPVERYPSREAAVEGHARWMAQIAGGRTSATMLGALGFPDGRVLSFTLEPLS